MFRRFLASSALPLTLALQGVCLTLVAFFSHPPAPAESVRIGEGDLPRADAAIAREYQIPRDLARERLPVPKFPKLDEPGKDSAPRPDPRKPPAPIVAGNKLAALRVSSVALAGLATMDSPVRIPDAPDALGLHDIGGNSGRSWYGGHASTGPGHGGFLGPSGPGFGPGGHGRDGDNCTPGRGGLIGRGGFPRGTLGPVVTGPGEGDGVAGPTVGSYRSMQRGFRR